MRSVLIFIGKCVSFVSQRLHKGSGSTWPGHIALGANQRFVADILSHNPHVKVVLIAGTNGKTTTSKLLRFILEKNGLKVFQNAEGANLLNGVASSLIRNSTTNGKITKDVAIFEIDENTLPLILKQVTPSAILLLNLFRDQLDRYGEVNSIAHKWQTALQKLPKKTKVFINGDDPQLFYLGQHLSAHVSYFGVTDELMRKKELPHDVDSIYCPSCRKKLVYKKISYSHLGDFSCNHCGFKRKNVETFSNLSVTYPLKGDYIVYNTNAALLCAYELFSIPLQTATDELTSFQPAFGRQEIIEYNGKKVFLLLSKNPTGFNQSIQTVIDMNIEPINALVLLNDRVADGHDISWIWDVEFETLLNNTQTLVISGDRTYDLAIRLRYSSDSMKGEKFIVEENLKEALRMSLERIPKGDMLYILATYTAMLDVRKLLLGKKLL